MIRMANMIGGLTELTSTRLPCLEVLFNLSTQKFWQHIPISYGIFFKEHFLWRWPPACYNKHQSLCWKVCQNSYQTGIIPTENHLVSSWHSELQQTHLWVSVRCCMFPLQWRLTGVRHRKCGMPSLLSLSHPGLIPLPLWFSCFRGAGCA